MQEDTYTGDINDPLSLNLYTYCHNEPLMYADPTGHWRESDRELNDDGKAKIIALTNAWYAVSTPEEKTAISREVDRIRGDETYKKQMDTLVKINNINGFYTAINSGTITKDKWNKAMKAIGATMKTTSATDNTTYQGISVKTIKSTTSIGKADITATVKDARALSSNVSSIGITEDIKTSYSAYIIYDSTQTNLGLFKADMKKQALDQEGQYKSKFGNDNVLVIGLDNANRLKEVWNSIGGMDGKQRVENVTMIFHGAPQSMAIGGVNGVPQTRIRSSNIQKDSNDIKVDELQQKNISLLNLSSCNTGSINNNDNLAVSFMKNQSGVDWTIGWDGTTMYNPYIINDDITAPDIGNIGKSGKVIYGRNANKEVIGYYYGGGTGWPLYIDSEAKTKNFGK